MGSDDNIASHGGTITGTAALVDFSSLGLNSCDIGSSTSIGGFGCTIGNVTFFYDDFGDPGANGTAQISAAGIDGFAGTGGLGGNLEFLFNATPSLTPGIWSFGAPISGGLVFQFSLFTATGPLQVADGAFTSLDNLLGDSATGRDRCGREWHVGYPVSQWPVSCGGDVLNSRPDRGGLQHQSARRQHARAGQLSADGHGAARIGLRPQVLKAQGVSRSRHDSPDAWLPAARHSYWVSPPRNRARSRFLVFLSGLRTAAPRPVPQSFAQV